MVWWRFGTFERVSGLNKSEIYQIIREGWQSQPETNQDGIKNILVLGLDSLETRGDSPPLTDTMMLVSLNVNDGKINTLPLPRDLWNDAYKTRINALYFYGQERYPEEPERFTREVITEMTGVKFQNTLVLSFDQVSQLIDLLGGIEIDVPVGFVDEEFPRTDVDVTVERDPAILYKTITFEEGKQIMGGERALEYMRSRKSGDDEGTDVARGMRQQLVIEALLSKLRQRDVIFNFELMGKLYKFYDDNFASEIPPVELIALGRSLYEVKEKIELKSHSLAIYPDDDNGVIWHPPVWLYGGEWVYAVRDSEGFRAKVQSNLWGNQ